MDHLSYWFAFHRGFGTVVWKLNSSQQNVSQWLEKLMRKEVNRIIRCRIALLIERFNFL